MSVAGFGDKKNFEAPYRISVTWLQTRPRDQRLARSWVSDSKPAPSTYMRYAVQCRV